MQSPDSQEPKTLRVVLIDGRQQRAEQMQRLMEQAGFKVLAVIKETADLYAAVMPLSPDAIIIDADSPSRDTLEHLSSLHHRFPKPMIMLSQTGSMELTRAAAQAGVSAYVVDGLSPGAMRSLVDVAMLHHLNHRRLHEQLCHTQQSLEDSNSIQRAKVFLMERHGFNEKRAHLVLRRLAMRRQQRMADLARAMLDAEGLTVG